MDKLKSTAESSKKPLVLGVPAEFGLENHGFLQCFWGGPAEFGLWTGSRPTPDRPRNGLALGAGKMANFGKIMQKPMGFCIFFCIGDRTPGLDTETMFRCLSSCVCLPVSVPCLTRLAGSGPWADFIVSASRSPPGRNSEATVQ